MVTRLASGREFDLIRSFLDGLPASGPHVRVGPGDDCAVVTGQGIAVSVDMAVEDVHFRRTWLPAADIGYHATAGALSDLAAVAARPIGVLASLALGPGDEDGTGRRFMGGVARAAADAGAILLGGDLTRSPGPLVVDITVLGEAASPILRSGARPGQELWVTGRLGGAAAAVKAWLAERTPERSAFDAYARPTPRTREAVWLAGRGVPTAMVDLSDGIAGDAGHIAAASAVRVVVRAASLPIAPAAAGSDGVALAAAGGEDYELCFTAAPGAVDAVRAEFQATFGVPLTRVGEVVQGTGAVVLDEDGEPLELEAFQHWRSR
jgi:thiamine-monophosphate kinase